jgi:hypothetical protein
VLRWGVKTRAGFELRAAPGAPFAHPAPRWKVLAPALSIARGIMERRYLRALSGPLEL